MSADPRLPLLEVYRKGLLEDVLPFWIQYGFDAAHGGFMTCLNRDGTVIDTDKGVWQQGRACWLFAKLFNHVDRREEWLNLARNTGDFLERYCFDAQDRRMWFHVTREGLPIRKRRYAFSEAFAAMAFGQLYRATQVAEYAEKAQALFRKFIDHHLEPGHCQPKFTNTRPMRGIGFPMITINVAQELRESIDLNQATYWIDRCIETIREFHVRPELECVLENVGVDGQFVDHFDGRTLNPGHAIEAAWFILWEGRFRGDSELIRLGCQMLDWMWTRGWDSQHGGLLYFVDVKNLPVQEYWHDMKFWWPQCEAIIATLLAWILTGEERYAEWHRQVHEWAHQHLADPEYGEWFGYLHRDARVSVPIKGNLWKGPFHLPRMQLLCWKMLEDDLESARQPE